MLGFGCAKVNGSEIFKICKKCIFFIFKAFLRQGGVVALRMRELFTGISPLSPLPHHNSPSCFCHGAILLYLILF